MGPRLIQCGVAWAEVYFRTKWRLHPFNRLATIDMGQKLAGVGVPFFLEGAGSPPNTKSPGPRTTNGRPKMKSVC